MKSIIFLGLFSTFCFSSSIGQISELEKLTLLQNQFLSGCVIDGRVDYPSIQAQRGDLDGILNVLESFDLSALSDDGEKAFWINAYNMLVIKSVVNHYPVQSPLDLPGFFDKTRHAVAGETVTLDEIEKTKLLAAFEDARIHFVLVCAAVSCPPISNKAFDAADLEADLEAKTRQVINDDRFVKNETLKKEIVLSEIFKWFETDFTAAGHSLIEFINQYRRDVIPDDLVIRFNAYNWSLNVATNAKGTADRKNLQIYTPSALMGAGQYEIKVFNNLYTQTRFYDNDSKKKDQGGRSTFLTVLNEFLYGVNSVINVGFELYVKSVRNDADESSTPLDVFAFSGGQTGRTAITAIAPKIKMAPFSRLQNLAIQSTFLFPTAGDAEGRFNNRPFLDYNDWQWWNQLFYDHRLNPGSLITFETGLLFRFDSDPQAPDHEVRTPLKLFYNYYPSGRWTAYSSLDFTPSWGKGKKADGTPNENNSHFNIESYWLQPGIGTKYQVTSHVELELLYTIFLAGKNAGAGQTYNLGIRLIN